MATGIYGGECIGLHTAYVYDRGGTTRVAQLLDLSSIRWTRDRDAVSIADLKIEGSACSAQAAVLAAIEPKRSEIVIFRGADRVWEGPVWRVGWFADHVEVEARDVMGYVHGTPMSIGYSSAYPNVETVTNRIKRIMDHEMPAWENLKDPPAKKGGAPVPKPANVLPHIVYHHFPNEAETTSVTKPFEMTVGEHIQHLAHYSGIDYTVVGRAIHFWDVSRSLGRTRTLTDADFFSEVVVTAYGADLSTRAIVIAQDGRYGEANAPSSYYGPWTTIHTSYNEEGTDAPTQGELDSQAQRSLSGRNPVPVEVRIPDSSGIRLSETLTINDLVPGVQIPLLATLNSRQIGQLQKLDFLTVTETAAGETVQVTLTPATKTDSDEEEPDD